MILRTTEFLWDPGVHPGSSTAKATPDLVPKCHNHNHMALNPSRDEDSTLVPRLDNPFHEKYSLISN